MDRFEALAALLAQRCGTLVVRNEEPMTRHTTFRIGGPAALMALPRTAGEAKAAVRAARELDIRPFFLGNGSNLLVPDEGYRGFVVKLCGLDQTREVNRRLWAESGISLARLANAALGRGLAGLEFAHGIPGTLGGGVMMNAGAYGGELSQTVTAVTYLDREGEEHTIPAAGCEFGYRSSIFARHPDWLILKAEFSLPQGDPEEIREKIQELARRRGEKQPLEYPSAGSMFKRPEGHFAAALIDQCGLKGLTVGGAQVSEKHAGVVINRGGPTCADVRSLVEQVRERVLRQNSNCTLAYVQLGRIYYRLEDYGKAMEYFKKGNFRGDMYVGGYGTALELYRAEFLRRHMGQIFTVVLLLAAAGTAAWLIVRYRRGKRRKGVGEHE